MILDFNQSKIMNVIDSNSLERDAVGKPASAFPHPALTKHSSAFGGRSGSAPGKPDGGGRRPGGVNFFCDPPRLDPCRLIRKGAGGKMRLLLSYFEN
jgi:hypothetical protein